MCNWGETAVINLGDKVIDVDSCIAPLVKALNDAGLCTVASCCGHGKQPGTVALVDGREIRIMPDYESSRMVDALFPPINEE